MTKILSLKMDEETLLQADRAARKLGTSRNAYINRAVRILNSTQERARLREIFRRESKIVRRDSLRILKVFEAAERAE